jgi:replicative superfamily II helicase
VVLVNASVGSGKTVIAMGAIIEPVYGKTGYGRKVLFLSPWVDLVLEQAALRSHA